ncbi:MAG: helix-turn-helix domain-containing protein [Spirochaetaceae bacterium]|jgi:transcriptional regulator with XRE-family HTH domain|nr:helix-turn-helix domain-containing protein [Spirochaetaceae bacterium]
MGTKTIGERVFFIRKHNKLTQTEFAGKLGLTHATISATEAGKVSLTEANLRLICLTFGVNEDWLREGIGDIFMSVDHLEHLLLNIFHNLSDYGKQSVYEFAEFCLNKERKENKLKLETEPDVEKGEVEAG